MRLEAVLIDDEIVPRSGAHRFVAQIDGIEIELQVRCSRACYEDDRVFPNDFKGFMLVSDIGSECPITAERKVSEEDQVSYLFDATQEAWSTLVRNSQDLPEE